MRRRNIMAAMGLVIVALLIVVTVYVSNLKAAEVPPSKETPPAPAAADQIKKLQARIDLLEKRLATLESSRTKIWDIVPINPQSPPGLKFTPAPAPNAPERDGFPKARIIYIDNNRTPVMNSDSGR